jgi:hypothetical protein
MEGNSKQARACESAHTGSGGARIEMTRSNSATTYWGILCRTCRQLTAFDTRPCISVGPGAPSMKPCAIRCGFGHNHIYFPRDFRLRSSTVPISDAVMQKNCEAFGATNPSSPASSSRPTWRAVEPEPNREPGSHLGSLDNDRTRSTHLALDQRRESAQIAAKERWTSWAMRKAM